MTAIVHPLAMAVLLLAVAAGITTSAQLLLQPLRQQLKHRQLDLYHRILAAAVAGATLLIISAT
jgi:hypothetical protein